MTELESDTWMAEVKRIRGKKPPLAAAGVQGLREEYTRSIEPARALAAETLKLERTLNDLVHQACRLREWSNEFGPQGVPGAEVIAEAE